MAPKHIVEMKLDWHLQNTVGDKVFLFELDLSKMLLLIQNA